MMWTNVMYMHLFVLVLYTSNTSYTTGNVGSYCLKFLIMHFHCLGQSVQVPLDRFIDYEIDVCGVYCFNEWMNEWIHISCMWNKDLQFSFTCGVLVITIAHIMLKMMCMDVPIKGKADVFFIITMRSQAGFSSAVLITCVTFLCWSFRNNVVSILDK